MAFVTVTSLVSAAATSTGKKQMLSGPNGNLCRLADVLKRSAHTRAFDQRRKLIAAKAIPKLGAFV
jgi:hypothetical protein